MIQLIVKVTKICVVFILSLLLGSCVNRNFEINGFTPISGSGNIITELREVPKNFDKIQVSSILKVELEQAPNYEIIVEADDNIMPYIVTEVEGSTLKVRFDNVSVSNIKEAKVYVKMPEISELRASSSSEIKAKKLVKCNDLVLKTSSTADMKLVEVNAKSVIMEASSSSDIEIGRLYAISCKAQSSSTADIEIDYIESDKIDLTATSSSDIELKGKTLDLTIDTSSTATVKAKELLANNITVSSSSSSEVSVYPIVSLKAKASSTADIYYYNEPKTIDKNTSSSGSIKRKQ